MQPKEESLNPSAKGQRLLGSSAAYGTSVVKWRMLKLDQGFQLNAEQN